MVKKGMSNMIRKYLLRGLITVIIISIAAGCSGQKAKTGGEKVDPNISSNSGLPIVKDKVTLKIAAPLGNNMGEFSEMEVFQKLEEKTNVHIEWEHTTQQAWGEKKNLMFASRDLPDAIANISDIDIVKYGPQGLLMPLDSLIDKYSVNLKGIYLRNPFYKKMLTVSDGKMYTFPRILEEETNALDDAMWINRVWMERLNLSMPKTTEEFRNVLKAFKERDPNGNGQMDEIPFSFVGGAGNNGLHSNFGAFGVVDNADHIMIKNGKLLFTAIQPEYKDAIQYFNTLYKERLIDPAAYTQKAADLAAKGKSKTPILGVFKNFNNHGVVGAERAADYVYLAPPVKGPKGDQIWDSVTPLYFYKGALALSSSNKNPEITMRWVDQIYEEDTSMQFAFGPYGYNQKLNPDGSIERMPLPEGMAFSEFRVKEAPANNFVYMLSKEKKEKVIADDTEKNREALYNAMKPYLIKELYPDVIFSEQDTDTLSRYKTDLYGYINKMQAKWIVEGGIENEWDAYVSQLKKMGLDEMMKVYQENLDRFGK